MRDACDAGELVERMEGQLFGKYRGVVKDNQDPAGRGRLEVFVSVMGDQAVWAMPCVPYAGANMGLYAMPEVGTGVWVEFEGGDVSFPIWVGCFWADKQAPENGQGAAATPALKILRTQQGLLLTLDDKREVITLSDKDGSNLVSVEVKQGKVTVRGTQKVVVEAPQIELVADATHPAVFGDKLLEYLNRLVLAYQTHTHPPPTLLPSSPLPPATPDLLSTRVRAG
jgi:hypothetical protein